ncbi:tyrosine-type recombinase/integrase [Abiotrophia defectiva]|uniref:site-specific integrase n=1 Tax=Abiotrophia defectiva TaxID=46125 RepID=UPI0028D08F2F|nr:tyrosine-type recombinase/integrase [Abiotrophia defectiva]
MWQYRISYYDSDGKRKTINKSGFRTKAEATAEARLTEADLIHGYDLESATTEFRRYFQRWYETTRMPYITERTQYNYRNTMKAIDSYFGTTSIGDISSDEYQMIVADYGKGHSHETTRKFHHHLKACFDYAFRNGVIKKDPTFSAKVVGKQSEKKIKYLSEADMNKLMSQVIETTTLDNTANYILILANATGMRIGEILGLTFDDVDIANQVISVRQSYDYVLTHKAKATKTESSVRQVKVDKVTCSYLAEIVDDRRSLCKTSDKNVDGFIFINRNTFKPISWTMVNKVLTRHCERAGVPRITTHAFRHTHISYLLNNDVYEQYVSERVGHADTTMIRRVYGHVLDELKAKSDDKVIHLLDIQKSSASH